MMWVSDGRGVRRHWLVLLLGALTLLAGPLRVAADDLPVMKVWKTPGCGCCGVWVDHVKAAGFRVEVTDLDDVTPIKTRQGVPLRLSSCHTAVVDGYVIEGHVPADDILRLLKERPAVRGIVVPGMPAGSPGMESPRPEPYDVLALDQKGGVTVFSSHRP